VRCVKQKRVEDTLLATYRQVSHLERELAKETEQMEEASLDDLPSLTQIPQYNF